MDSETDQIQAQEITVDTEEIYRLLVENANEAIYVTQNGYITYANSKSMEMIGYSIDDLKSKPFVELIHPEDREMVLNRHVRRMTGENFFNVYPHRIVDKKGSIKWLEINVVLLEWNGNPAILNFANDITDRKLAEDSLRESEDRYRSLFHSTPAGVFYYDSDLKIHDVNDRFVAMFQIKKECSSDFNLRFFKDPKIISCIEKPIDGREGHYEGRVCIENDGDTMWIFMHTSPVWGGNGDTPGGIGIVQDVTIRKHAEEALIKREKELKIKSHHLEDANAALRVLLRHREEDRSELQQDVLSNVRELIAPYIEKLKHCRSDIERDSYVNIIETNLNNIASPFLRNMTLSHYNLTPKEIQVASLIKEGKSTKEMARLLNLSSRSVEYHRDKIRDKLGLKKQKANLRSYLMTLS